MVFEIRRSAACRTDLEAIFDHLLQSQLDLGETVETALDRAATRLATIEDDLDALGQAPFQGTLWPEVMTGLRWVTKNRAVIYFTSDADAMEVRILAVFFGGQDHKAHMLQRILQNTPK